MDQDTIDKDTQDWERIDAAIAFQLPDESVVLIWRQVFCPDPACGHALVLVLGTGDVINYVRRHQGCKMEEVRNDG